MSYSKGGFKEKENSAGVVGIQWGWRTSRNSRRRLSVAPASIPAASALQLSFDLMENRGNGKLLGGGDTVNNEPENSSTSFLSLPPAAAAANGVRSFGRSFGSGPNGNDSGTAWVAVDSFCFHVSFIFLLGSFDFLGVLVFLMVGGQEMPRLRSLGDC